MSSTTTATGKGETKENMAKETELHHDNKSPQNKRPRYKNTIHLWEFLLELLADERNSSLIAWSRKDYGEFKLKNQEEVAKRWGNVKHRAGMNYEKLSRAIRYYYHQGIIQKVPGQRLVYKFGKLPYEYKPRVQRPAKTETMPVPAPLDQVKQDSHAFLPLTSLTPPPEIGYQFPSLLHRNLQLSPMCSCYVDYSFGTACALRNFPPSPILIPHSCGYTFNMLNNAAPSRPPRAIPVPVITSTNS